MFASMLRYQAVIQSTSMAIPIPTMLMYFNSVLLASSNPAYLILDIVNKLDPGSETRAPVLQAFHVILLVSQLRRRARFLGHCNRFERSRSTKFLCNPSPNHHLLYYKPVTSQDRSRWQVSNDSPRVVPLEAQNDPSLQIRRIRRHRRISPRRLNLDPSSPLPCWPTKEISHEEGVRR